MEETVGYIYILTNPSFPEYVKIGYADDVEKRLNTMKEEYDFIPSGDEMQDYIDKSLNGLFNKGGKNKGTER